MVRPEAFDLTESEHVDLMKDIYKNVRAKTDVASEQIEMIRKRYAGKKLLAGLHYLGFCHGRISYEEDESTSDGCDTNGHTR